MDRDTFTYRHPDAVARASLYAFLLDAWDGTGGFSPPLDEIMMNGTFGSAMADEELPAWKGVSYLDQFPRESGAKWRSRVRRAHYTNLPRTVGETICGFLLSRQPTRSTTDETLLAFEADADGLGHSWDELMRSELARRLWLLASPLILVDRPAELAESRADDLGTYATILPPQMLYDWETDDAGELLWVKLVDKRSECENAEAESVEYYTATEWTRNGWRRWRMNEGSDADPFLVGEGTHPCGVVPLVIGTMSRPVGASILGTSESFEIAQESRKLYNYQSLLDSHLYDQVYAVLAVVMAETGKREGFKLGTDNALVIPSGGSASYIAPPQSVAEVLFKSIDACIRRVYRAARLEFTVGDSAQAASGVARQYEFSATNRALCSFAAELSRIERETKRMVLLWEGVTDVDAALNGSVPLWPDSFDVKDLERSLKLGLDAMTLPLGETAKAALIKTLRDDLVELSDEPREGEELSERERSDREIEEEARIGRGVDAPLGAYPPADGGVTTEASATDETGGLDESGNVVPLRPGAVAATSAVSVPTTEILTASGDKASVVTVNEARASIGLPALTLPGGQRDPDGDLTVEDFREKRKALRSAQEAKMRGDTGPSVNADSSGASGAE